MNLSSAPARRRVSSPTRPLSMVLAHWTTVLLVLAAVFVVLLRESSDGDVTRKALLLLHQQLGLSVLAIVLVRIFLHLLPKRPEPQRPSAFAPMDPTPLWQRLAAAVVHGLLYAAVLALPLFGWAAGNARGDALSWLGLPLPRWVAERDLDLADELIERHQAVAWVLLALVVAHAGAALWHHVVLRDDVLVRMLPWRRGGNGNGLRNKQEKT